MDSKAPTKGEGTTMNTFLPKISIVILIACILAACGAAPSPAPTQIPPKAELAASTPLPQLSRTPLPQPTRRPSQTPTPTEINAAYKIPEALTGLCQEQYYDKAKFSPSKRWYICGGSGGDFNLIDTGRASWRFSAKNQFDTDYDGSFSLLHWTGDEKFLYFAFINSVDGPFPITVNAEMLFRMDLSTGKVTIVLGDIPKNYAESAARHLYAVSISPTSRILAYAVDGPYTGDVPPQQKLHLVDLQNSDEKIIPIEPEYQTIGEFVWSEDGQQLVYTLYNFNLSAGDYTSCKYAYSIRWLNLADYNAITFIKNISIDPCANNVDRFKVLNVSTGQVTLEKGNERWAYDVQSQRLELQGTVTPSP